MIYFPVEYSTLSVNALSDLLRKNYAVAEKISLSLIKRGFNDTYLLQTASQDDKFILRVYKHNWRTLESIESELALLVLLKNEGINVSYPIADKSGAYIQTINAPEGLRYAVLFSYAQGNRIKKLSTEQAHILGIACGKMHSKTNQLKFTATAHNYNIQHQFDLALTTVKPILSINYAKQYNYLVQLKKEFLEIFSTVDANQLAQGICHGDLQAENFHITENNTITFFDFDFFGTSYLAYDIGVFMWYDHKNKPPEIVKAFLNGYVTQRALSQTEIMLLPYFGTLRALFQITLFCTISDGKQLPVWPAQQIAEFVDKIEVWKTKSIKFKV